MEPRNACAQLALPAGCTVLFSPSHEQLPARDLADWILADRLPVRFQIQLHKYLWGNVPGKVSVTRRDLQWCCSPAGSIRPRRSRIARAQGFDCHALSVDYGQRHVGGAGGGAARGRGAGVLRAPRHARRPRRHRRLGAHRSQRSPCPRRPTAGIPVTYVPARNTMMLSLALAWAEVLGARDIFIGVNVLDSSGYPDCRPEFIAAFEALARLATKAGVEGEPCRIHTPLIALTKAEIIRAGTRLGVDYA